MMVLCAFGIISQKFARQQHHAHNYHKVNVHNGKILVIGILQNVYNNNATILRNKIVPK